MFTGVRRPIVYIPFIADSSSTFIATVHATANSRIPVKGIRHCFKIYRFYHTDADF